MRTRRLTALTRFAAAAALCVAGLAAPAREASAQAPRFEVTYTAATTPGPLTGRLIVVLAKSATPEPRLTVFPSGPALLAVDLEALPPGRAAVVDGKALGYPGPLASLPPGEYHAQAVVNVYEQVRRSDGHTIWLPMNDGRQEFFSNAAGNLYSDVQKVRVGAGGTVRLALTHRIEAPPKPVDTEWVKHVSVQSRKLTEFWGRPTFIHATILLPKGYAEHPEVRYPVVYTLGHDVPFSFTTDSTRVRGLGKIDPVRGVETGYDFYRSWSSDGFPRFIAVSLEQQTPYFPDSYSVNSANNGPYGDAVVGEVMPAIERQFRAIGQPWARLVEGASTGGWQSLALQLQHPDFFGGAWVLQPDPIDFRRWQHTDIYADTNAFVVATGPATTAERPFRRTVEGQVVWTQRQMSLFEQVLGTRGRSGFQQEAWEAVYGPVGADGYPKPLWNRMTGTIDREVATYMRDHGFDLREYVQRNWSTLGPKLAGKLHFLAGDMDDFYLNLAVYKMEEFLKSATNPTSDAEFTYGRPMKGHSWHAFTWAEMVRRMGEHVRKNAPAGVDTGAWRY